MAKTLDIKRLSKGMSLQDKAKILFADRNKKAETAGLERLLTPEEEDAIIEDARKNNQVSELNRLDNLYKMANLLLLDIQTAFLNFGLAKSKLEGILMAIHLTEGAKDILYQLIYDIAGKSKAKVKELEKKHITDKLYFDKYFGFFYSNDKKEQELNAPLQIHFIDAVERLKRYKEVRYQLDYIIEEVASIDFLSDKQNEDLKKYDDHFKEFINLEGVFKTFRVFKDFADKGAFKTTYRTSDLKDFSEVVKDINKAIELTEKDKKEAREQIDDILARHNI